MELIGAGLAALGVIGPGLGIGILTGMSTSAIGRNPDAAPQIRATFIIGAAFAEGLGVLAVVVGILAIFVGGRAEHATVDILAVARTSLTELARFYTEAGGEGERTGRVPNQPVLGRGSGSDVPALPRHRLSHGLPTYRGSWRSGGRASSRGSVTPTPPAVNASRRQRSGSASSARRGGKPTTSWRGRSAWPRNRASGRSPRPAPRSSGYESRRRWRSTPSGSGPWPMCAARSPTWAPRRGQGRGGDHEHPRERRLVDEFLTQVGSAPADGPSRTAPA